MYCKICSAQYRENEECPNLINHEQGKNYQAMKKDELIASAQEKGIELTGEENKAELIALLEKV